MHLLNMGLCSAEQAQMEMQLSSTLGTPALEGIGLPVYKESTVEESGPLRGPVTVSKQIRTQYIELNPVCRHGLSYSHSTSLV